MGKDNYGHSGSPSAGLRGASGRTSVSDLRRGVGNALSRTAGLVFGFSADEPIGYEPLGSDIEIQKPQESADATASATSDVPVQHCLMEGCSTGGDAALITGSSGIAASGGERIRGEHVKGDHLA